MPSASHNSLDVGTTDQGNRTEPESSRDWKTLVTKITGVLVVVPALLNAAFDIYATASKLPRTDAERVNSELFKKYFNKPPIAIIPLPIKHSLGVFEAKFQIFEEGEIYVEYGRSSQWFAFPSDVKRQALHSLFPTAQAQETNNTKGEWSTVIKQSDTLNGKFLLRERVLSDGMVSRSKIDIRTGNIIEESISKDRIPKLEAGSMQTQTYKFNGISISR
jgi:hypothetical protein